MTAPLTLDLDQRTLAALDRLAVKTARPRDWLIARAVEDFVAISDWQIAKIEAGIAAAEQGDFATDEEMALLRTQFSDPSVPG